MAYIEFHQALVSHRKVLKMAGVLKMRRAAVAGHMAFLWSWALDNAQSGDLTDIDDEAIKLAADWPKSAETFIGAAIYAGFIDNGGGRRVLHDWQDYGGKLIEKRASDAKRKREERTAKGHPTDGAGRAEQTSADKSRADKPDAERTPSGQQPCRWWYQHVIGKPPSPKQRAECDRIQKEHGFDCVEAVWRRSQTEAEYPWAWVQTVFGHGNDHEPRNRGTQPDDLDDDFAEATRRAQ